jgi:DNA invertase Pin-like site-specific DNA recombinase
VLVVSKLDRLSRSMSEFANLLDGARRKGWEVVALDIDIDTTTAGGELFAHMMAALAQWERRVISERAKDGLAAAKARGTRLGPAEWCPIPAGPASSPCGRRAQPCKR